MKTTAQPTATAPFSSPMFSTRTLSMRQYSSRHLGALLALVVLALLFVSSPASAASKLVDAGTLDGEVYYQDTISGASNPHFYYVYLPYSGMTLQVQVQDVGGRGFDRVSLTDPHGRLLAESRNRIGAAIGARNLSQGWHHVFLESSKPNHQYGLTLRATRGDISDFGNDFNRAFDVGVLGDRLRAYPNYVGVGGDSADFLRFQLTQASNQLEITLAEAPRNAAIVELYALNGASVANFVSRAYSKGSNTPVLIEKLPAGTYWARVTAAQSGAARGTFYRILLRSRTVAADGGGDFNHPSNIGIPTRRPILDQLDQNTDRMDVYQFNVPQLGSGGSVRFTVTGQNTGRFSVYLIQGTNNFLTNRTNQDQQKVIQAALQPGTHRLMIIDQGSTVSYSLSVEVIQPRPAPTPRPTNYCVPDASNVMQTACILYPHPSPNYTNFQIQQSVGGAGDPADWFLSNIGCNIPSQTPSLQIVLTNNAVGLRVLDSLGRPVGTQVNGSGVFFRMPNRNGVFLQFFSRTGAAVSYQARITRISCF